MQYLSLIVLLTISLTFGVFAQSAKVKPNTSNSSAVSKDDLSAEKMYLEANDYAKNKFNEFNEKKISFNEALRLKTLREQKELAAKYAAILAVRQDLNSEDIYYWGMLHWTAENTDGAEEVLRKYLETENLNAEKAQTARGIVVIATAKKKNFSDAENFLAEYLSNQPIKKREKSEMENELANAYFSAKDYSSASLHGEKAYNLVKELLPEQTSRARALAEILDRGKTLFEIYRDSRNQEKSDATLEDLRKISASIESNGIYYYAVDNQIKYLIETNRKLQALKIIENLKKQIENDFTDKRLQGDLTSRFFRRETHYKLIGETAPELIDINSWIPAQSQTLGSLRGKVVVLDFWATWCGPCYETFPVLSDLQNVYQKDGLEVLGITRFYGSVEGEEVSKTEELKFLQSFKEKHKLPYSFVVSQNNTNQIVYGAGALPTAVVVDRKGIIRYIETGTNSTRGEEIQAVVEKLLAEK